MLQSVSKGFSKNQQLVNFGEKNAEIEILVVTALYYNSNMHESDNPVQNI